MSEPSPDFPPLPPASSSTTGAAAMPLRPLVEALARQAAAEAWRQAASAPGTGKAART